MAHTVKTERMSQLLFIHSSSVIHCLVPFRVRGVSNWARSRKTLTPFTHTQGQIISMQSLQASTSKRCSHAWRSQRRFSGGTFHLPLWRLRNFSVIPEITVRTTEAVLVSSGNSSSCQELCSWKSCSWRVSKGLKYFNHMIVCGIICNVLWEWNWPLILSHLESESFFFTLFYLCNDRFWNLSCLF